MKDGSLSYKTGSANFLIAISGDGKSPHLASALAQLKSPRVLEHFKRSNDPRVRALAASCESWIMERGGSSVAFLETCAEAKSLAAGRLIMEEVNLGFNKIDENDKGKMSVSMYIFIFNPETDVGRNTVSRGSKSVKGVSWTEVGTFYILLR